jgi:hypothetical protein
MKNKNLPIRLVENTKKIDRIVVFGSKYHTENIRSTFLKLKEKYKIECFNETFKLECKPTNKEKIITVFLENIFDHNSLVNLLKSDKIFQIKSNKKNIYCLITTIPEVIKTIDELYNYFNSNNLDIKVLEKIDYIFHFNGNQTLYPTILNLIEDKINFRYDNERLILVVEDTPVYYSSFLQTIYKINSKRTRILLARNFEEADYIIDNYSSRLAGTIIDLSFPKEGKQNENASWELKNKIDKMDLKIPIIFQSADEYKIKRIESEGQVFALYKDDPELTYKLSNIINRFFGFGLFEVRLPYGDKRTIAKIKDLKQLKVFIEISEPDILVGHARYNDFSNWLAVQGYKNIAKRLKPIDPFEIMQKLKRKYPNLNEEEVYYKAVEIMRQMILKIIEKEST